MKLELICLINTLTLYKTYHKKACICAFPDKVKLNEAVCNIDYSKEGSAVISTINGNTYTV